MPRTSDKAQLIVDYVNQFVQENGYSPSVREIGAAVGLRSTASVSYHLQALQAKGLLQTPGAKGRKRALVTGARPGQIQMQFLIESFLLSMVGGLSGVVLGIALSAILCSAMSIGFTISYGAIGLGVGFSAAVGILFGWSPARKASALKPIDALRRM